MGRWGIRRGELQRLRKDCESQIADLPIPSPFSLPALINAIEISRQCRIHLIPVHDPHGDMRTACGLRVTLERLRSTFILYRPRPTPNQTEHTIFHELAHLWFDHGTNLSEPEKRNLLPHLFQRFISDLGEENLTVQARASYESHEERQAELAACLIKAAARRRETVGTDLVSVVEASLTHPLIAPR